MDAITELEPLQQAIRCKEAGLPPLRGDDPAVPVVTVIGGGYSGTATAIKLMANATGPLRIGIVEPRTELGRGLAYSTREAAHLMNGPAKTFTLNLSNPSGGLTLGGTTTTTVTIGAPVVTTTTTTYVEETVRYSKPKKVWRAPARKVWQAKRCSCN